MALKVKKIGLLTSGGDAPGMNAAIRAVVNTAAKNNIAVEGIFNGYTGLINKNSQGLSLESVSNIIHRGGTILGTARCQEFYEKEGRERAYGYLSSLDIDGLVVIGGDGTFAGADLLGKEFDLRVVGIPGTIDNDLYGTDVTLGYDTALNTVVEAIDKIRDTAQSHHRLFFVEVMGKDAGFIALRTAIAGGANSVLVPEEKTDIDKLIDTINNAKNRYGSAIIIVAEGDDAGGALEVANKVKKHVNSFETRVSILGHMQRGGNPSAMDRVLGSSLGYQSVMALIEGESGCMVGQINRKIAFTQFDKATKHNHEMNQELLQLVQILSS